MYVSNDVKRKNGMGLKTGKAFSFSMEDQGTKIFWYFGGVVKKILIAPFSPSNLGLMNTK